MKTILVTGGAGFIGSHVTDKLIAKGYSVRILDKLINQVHEDGEPAYISPKADLLVGDICNKHTISRALKGVDTIIHLAAEVGVGQSMYEIERYINTNTRGTATLFDAIVNGNFPIKRIITASSMSIYGEGTYICEDHGVIYPQPRTKEQLEAHEWHTKCSLCKKTVKPIATPESQPLNPTSIYAISKMDQELITLNMGRFYQINTIALRFFNTYGPRQALSNPYTGLAAIFGTQLLTGRSPQIFEDGHQLRDLIHVDDVSRAIVKAVEATNVSGIACNIGTGKAVSVHEVAKYLNGALKLDIQPTITNNYRAGDIRHCWADTRLAKELFDFEATIDFKDGVYELAEWIKGQQPKDRVNTALEELRSKGLSR